MRPLIQLKIPPPKLCSPGDLCFAKERLTQEECFEEMRVNKILPKPFHNKLSTIPIKHTTHCLATTTHYLLRKKMFHSKISQATKVVEKKLPLAINGRKYDPGKKFPKQKPHDKPEPKKKKAAKMDEPKTDRVVKIPEDKKPSPEKLGEPQSDDDDNDDSLPEPFSLPEPKRPKMLGTKEDQDEESTQTQTMDTDMPELISSDKEAAPQKTYTTKKPLQKKLPHK